MQALQFLKRLDQSSSNNRADRISCVYISLSLYRGDSPSIVKSVNIPYSVAPLGVGHKTHKCSAIITCIDMQLLAIYDLGITSDHVGDLETRHTLYSCQQK